jgi:hypothetical protein
MKLALLIHSTEAETVVNAFRLCVFALKQVGTAKAFFLAKGNEAESLPQSLPTGAPISKEHSLRLLQNRALGWRGRKRDAPPSEESGHRR